METQTKFSNLKDAVAQYQELGWRVMPVNIIFGIDLRIDKVPVLKNWTDPDTIFDFTVKHNSIGVVTGKISNITVLDIDTKNGNNGFLTLERLGIDLPATVCAVTPSGGKHYFFKYSPELQTKTAVLGSTSAIDIRNDGGFIVLAPSKFPDGRPYQWLEAQAPSEIELAEFPKDLLDAILKVQKPLESKPYEVPEKILNGQRNAELARYAGMLRNKGLEEAEIEPALQAINQTRCEPPEDPEVVAKIARSVSRYAKGTAKNPTVTRKIGAVCNLDTVVNAIFEEPVLSKAFWFDSFHNKIFTNWAGEKKELTDEDIIGVQLYLQRQGGLLKVPKDTVRDAIQYYASINSKNEALDWLTSLDWDKTPRIERLFQDYFGAKSDDVNDSEYDEYLTCLGKNFLISIVARVFRPGCKVDNMLILEGIQGAGKSSSLSALVGENLFCECHENVTTKDFFQVLQGKALVEIAELEAFSKAETTKIKQVISCQVDRYRAPYGRYPADHPRQCVFVGTTNDDSYLKDPTGARRFWPVKVGHIDVTKIKNDRNQLFAEAVCLYKEKSTWWEVPNDIFEEQQEERRQTDVWEAPISKWLAGRVETTSEEIATDTHCLQFYIRDVNHSVKIRISNVMKVLGWENKVSWKDGKPVRLWVPKKRLNAPKAPENLQANNYED